MATIQKNVNEITETGVANLLGVKVDGKLAVKAVSELASAAQGTKADTAVQPGSLATVATSGAYNDLSGKPTLGTAAAQNTTAFATAAQGTKADSAVQPGDTVFDVRYLRKLSSGDLSLADSTAISFDGDTGDAATNTAEINTLISSIPAFGGILRIPPGNFAVQGFTPISNKHITVQGCGRGLSRFLVTGNSGNLFTVSQNSQNLRSRFTGFSAIKHSDASTAGAAISCTYPEVSSSLADTIFVQDIECRGATGTTQFAALLLPNNAWHTTALDLEFSGIDNSVTAVGAIAMQGKCTILMANRIKSYWADTAISAQGGFFGEGYYIENVHAVATNYLAKLDSGIDAPGAKITNCHGETFRYGVYSLNRGQVEISGNLFYKRLASTQNWTAVWIEANGAYNSDTCAVNNNLIFGFKGSAAGGTATGFVIDDSDISAGSGNIVRDCDVGIDLLSNSNTNFSFYYNNVTTPSQNVPAGGTVTATLINA